LAYCSLGLVFGFEKIVIAVLDGRVFLKVIDYETREN